MVSLTTEIPTEADKEGRMRKQRGSAGLEEFVRESREALLQAQEREKDMQARMQDEIIKQVQIAMSAQR